MSLWAHCVNYTRRQIVIVSHLLQLNWSLASFDFMTVWDEFEHILGVLFIIESHQTTVLMTLCKNICCITVCVLQTARWCFVFSTFISGLFMTGFYGFNSLHNFTNPWQFTRQKQAIYPLHWRGLQKCWLQHFDSTKHELEEVLTYRQLIARIIFLTCIFARDFFIKCRVKCDQGLAQWTTMCKLKINNHEHKHWTMLSLHCNNKEVETIVKVSAADWTASR